MGLLLLPKAFLRAEAQVQASKQKQHGGDSNTVVAAASAEGRLGAMKTKVLLLLALSLLSASYLSGLHRNTTILNSNNNRQQPKAAAAAGSTGNNRNTNLTRTSGVVTLWTRKEKELVDAFSGVWDASNRRLVVQGNASLLFWRDGGAGRLCDLFDAMQKKQQQQQQQQALSESSPLPAPLLNLTLDCWHLVHSGMGEGNYITAFYCVRMAAATAGVDLQFQCHGGPQNTATAHHQALLPWFTGLYRAPSSTNDDYFANGERPATREEACCMGGYRKLRLDRMLPRMRHDLRALAVKVVGSRGSSNSTSDVYDALQSNQRWTQPGPAFFPNVELDDVAIHFRCGDVMGGARRNDFGVIHFGAYKKYLRRDAQSVGIVTQPFDKDRVRGLDARRVHHCRRAVLRLVDYLQQFLPNATTISIRNGANETLPLAYARLVMAKYQSFTSLSSFGIFPIVAAQGQGFFQRGNYGVNPWANYAPQTFHNLNIMSGPVLPTGVMYRMITSDRQHGFDRVLDWFVSDNPDQVPSSHHRETPKRTLPHKRSRKTARRSRMQESSRS